MNKSAIVLTAVITVVLIVLASVMPAQSVGPSGAWRLISPTEYTSTPDAELHGIFLTSGGTSGKGSGSGWAVGANGFIFNWDGFSWNQASSGTSCELDAVNFGGPLNPLSSVTSSSGWAVGGCDAAANDGVGLYYNGVSWVSYPVPSAGGGRLLSISLVKSASSTGDSVNAFAVGIDGANGAFWSWNGVPGSGGAWSELSTTITTTQVNSVYMTHCSGSPCTGDDGIAVGNGGTIFRYVGGIWTARASPVGAHLYGVAMSSPTNGWAVGDGGTIIRTTDGNTWTGPVSPGTTTNPLRSIVLLSSSEAYAVGDADANGATVLHGISLDSTPVWSRLPVNQVATPLGLDSVTFATSGGNIWSVGKSGVAAFCLNNCSSASSAIWSTTTSPNTLTLNSVFMVSDSDGWAVGVADPVSGYPTVLRWDGGTFSWTRAPFVAPLVNPTSLNGVYLSGGSSGWAVGGATGPVPSTLWYDGNTWAGKTVGSPCACVLNSVYMVSDSNSWAVGTAGTIMHSSSSGGSFSIAPSSVVGATYQSVFFDPSSGGMSGWAAGTDGANALMVHTTNGGADAWPVAGIPALPGVTLNSLFFQDSTHAWAAGTKSTILYWNGISWTLVGIVGPSTITIDGIAVTGGPPATDGWAVGVDTATGLPVTIHYDGTSWIATALTPAIPNMGELKSLSLRSSTNGLAVGTGVTGAPTTLDFILHLDPPGSFQNTVVQQTTVTNTVTTSSSTSSTTSSLSGTQTTSSTTASSESTSSTESTSSESTSTTAASTSVSTVTIQNTPTTTTQSTSSVSTPMALPAIPGFPWESIVAGIMLGVVALAILRRRRQ